MRSSLRTMLRIGYLRQTENRVMVTSTNHHNNIFVEGFVFSQFFVFFSQYSQTLTYSVLKIYTIVACLNITFFFAKEKYGSNMPAHVCVDLLIRNC